MLGSRPCRAQERCSDPGKMWPMGWEALEQWGADVARIEPLTGGVANHVWSVRVNGKLAVGRFGVRSDADLAWETDLMRHLDHEGLTVPVPIATTDGRQFADGLMVMTHVEGGPPETESDWRRVAKVLRQLHQLTPGLATTPGMALVDRPAADNDWDEDRPRRYAARGHCPMPSSMGAARRASEVRRPRKSQQPRQHPGDR
jgi:Ser/Thr protein kinase RdoA (MazF antagonist)